MFIGVDFGTSFSQVAAYHNKAITDLNEKGEYGIPSVFYYDAERGELVGKEALAEAVWSADNLVRNVKMRLDEQFVLDAREFSANEIVGQIYREIISFAKQKGPEKIIDFQLDGIVITHPAKFSMAEVNALSEAAKNCLGVDKALPIVGALKEPVAAALSYFNNANDQFNDGDGILVFDLGGGTCDVALVTVNKNDGAEYVVIDSDMERVGGRDWDNALYEYAKEKIVAMTNGEVVIDGNADFENDLYESVVKAKHTLSKSAQTSIRPQKISHASLRRGIPITRTSFMELTQDLLDKTIVKLVEMYKKHQSNVNIKSVILVGGSSNMPQVEDAISAAIPNCEVKRYEPESAVVNGAAIFATKVMEKLVKEGYGLPSEQEEKAQDPSAEMVLPTPTIVQDILAHSYGVRCRKSQTSNEFVVKNLLIKGSKFPAAETFDRFSVTTNATSVYIEIYESDNAEDIYNCDGTQNEKYVGDVILQTPNGITVNDHIECKLTVNDLTTIFIDAKNIRTGEKVASQFNIDPSKNSNN